MTAERTRWPLTPSGARLVLAALLLSWTVLSLVEARAQAPDQAAMLLDSARRAYNEKNYPFAVTRFREYLQKFAGSKEAPQARYGLALALVEGPERDYAGGLEQLGHLAGAKNMPEHPYVLYYTGLCYRGLGTRALAQAEAKPAEANQHKDNARGRFEEAARQFAAAATAFSALVKNPDPNAKEVPIEVEWAARARCDQAEMLLRLGKTKEAQATAAGFLDDKALARSRYRGLGLYYHGFAGFLLKDNLLAGRSLSKLAPFTDPVYGTHARYLLARIHHQDGERQEAVNEYEGLLAEFGKQKTAAGEALKQPERFKNDPDEKARLEQLARGTPPDHVARSLFFLGVMQYEDGRFAEAQARFAEFAKQMPSSPLVGEVRLREGFCQVQLKQFAEAQKTLQPLVEKEPRLADQALLWIGKAQAGAADPAKPQEHEQALRNAIATLKQAADRADKQAKQDPAAKVRHAEVLAELADVQQHARQYRETAAGYQQALAEKALPQREEELTLSLATAYQLAGDYPKSDEACVRFRDAFPGSTLLPAVLFRHAENAYFSALQSEKLPKGQERERDVQRWNDEAIKRYQVVVEKYPEFAQINLARYGLALCFYRKGDVEKTKEKLDAIPAGERNGELALVAYQLADCLIRLAPTRMDNAVTAGMAEEMLKGAIEQLESFIGANPNAPQTPDALIKLGHCLQRQAGILAQPPERQKALAGARAAYEQLAQKFPKSPEAAQAFFERARVLALQGDPNNAMNELRRFSHDPLKNTAVAPMAQLQLAALLRAQNKPAEAVDVLAKCRQEHEPRLTQDPARAGWVPLLMYHHGVALREAGKRAEARAILDQVVKQTPDRPEAAEAALRSGQCLKDDAQQRLADAQKRLAQPNLKPEEQQAAHKAQADALKEMQDAIAYLQKQTERLGAQQPQSEARARLMYETAWAFRTLADLEIAEATRKVQHDLWQKRRDELAKKLRPGQEPPTVPLPQVPLSAVPVQPAETSARNQYQALLGVFPDLNINADARFELAEMLSERGEHDAAVKLLREALDKEPAPQLTDKVRLRLGNSLLAKGDAKAALAQFNTILANPKSAQLPQALYRSGECLLQMKDNAEAARRLARFRDEGPLHNVPGVSDRALLRLGHALDRLKDWDGSRKAFETLVNRFPNSHWLAEARYGLGWAYQNQQQFDQTVTTYGQVTGLTASELGARAQMNIGLCRLAQKRYPEATTALLVVPFTYDYPQLSALSLVEAARAFTENKQPDQAVRLLERVLRDHPETDQAEAARKRLEELKKGQS